MSIPKMLFICVQNERGVVCKPLFKPTLRLLRYHKNVTPEQRKKHNKSLSGNKKKWWKRITEEERRDFCEMRAAGLREFFDGLTEEEIKERCRPAHETTRKLLNDPKTRDKFLVQRFENLKKINKTDKIEYIEDVTRINDYAGVITASDLEKLSA